MVVVCFRYATPSHYHHDTWLLACIEHKKMLGGWVYHVESVSKTGLVISIAFFAIYGVAYVELAHSSLGDWKDIFITHLIIIIKSEVSTVPIVVIFFRGCVSEMVVLSYSVIYYIYIPVTLGPCFLYYVQSMVFQNDRIHWSCSFVCRLHHLIIIIMQTYLKALNY